ncbi:MAG: PAS domain S-box protein [Anaerolineales bacterium]|nr:PAS domain S-box protein [Anaerolineales bacterium]
MFQRLKKWLTMPEQEQNLLRLDLAWFLTTSLWASTVLSLIAIFVGVVFQIPNWARLSRDAFVVLGLSLLFWGLLRHGRTQWAVYGLLGGFTIFAAFSAFTGVGVRGTAYGLLLVIIMLAALFLHRRAAYVMAFVSSLIGLGLILANRAGLLPNVDRPLAETASWLIQTTYFFITAVVLDIALRQIDRALRKAQFELEERTRAEEKILALNTALEQRVAERTAQLAASEERYRMITEISSDYVFSTEIDANGRHSPTWVAGAFETIMGYTFEEYKAQGGWLSVLHPEDVAQDAQNMADLYQNKRVVTEVRIITQTGAVRWIKVYGYPVWDPVENRLKGINGAAQDISHRKQIEEALREAELQYRSLVEQTSVVIYRDAPVVHAPTLYISPQIEKLLGYTPEEWTSGELRWPALLHPDDLAATQAKVQTHLQTGGSFTDIYRIRARDGRWVWVRDEAVVITDAEGVPRYIQGVLLDITEQKLAEEALQASENRFRALVEQLPAITYSDDIHQFGHTRYISPQVETILGYSAQDWITGGMDFWLNHIHPEDQAHALAQFQACFDHGTPVNSEYRMFTHHGDIVWLQDRAVRLEGENGLPALIQGVMVDITGQKQAENQLTEQSAQLSALYQLSQEIVASLDLDQICTSAHRAVAQLMPTDAFFIALVDEARQEIEDVYLFDRGQRWPNRRTPLAQRGMSARVIQTQAPLYIEDEAATASAALGTIHFGTSDPTRSLLMAPLRMGGQVLGVLSAQNYQPKMYTASHVEILINLGNQVAIAIEHARLVRSLRLQAIALDAAANAIVMTDQNGIIQWVNPAFTSLTGYSFEEVVGKSTRLLNSGQHPPDFYRNLWQTVLAGTPWHGEIINRRKDGSLYTEEQLITPVRNEQGEIFRFVAIKQDVTARKLAEQRLAASEERYRNFIAQSSEGIWRIEHEIPILTTLPEDEQIQQMVHLAYIAECNEAMARMYGYPSARDLLGKRLNDLLPISDAANMAYLRQFIRSGYRLSESESHEVDALGQDIYFMNSIVGVVENGALVRSWGLQRDITEQKVTQSRAQRRRKLLEKVIELGKTVAQETDLQTCLRQIYYGVRDGLEFDRVGLFLYEAQTGLIRGAFGTSRTGEIEDTSGYIQLAIKSEAWQRALSHPSGINKIEDYTTLNQVTAENEMFGVKQHVSLAAWAGEKPIALIAADNLLTQRPITPEQLEGLQLFAGYAGLAIVNARWNAELGARVAERTEELEAANQELQAFTYTIAHDLRAPARAMIGFSGLLEEHLIGQVDLDALSLRYLARVQNGAKRMGQMIDELLEYTRLGRLRIYNQRVDMQTLVEKVLVSHQREITRRNVHMILHPLPSCQGDPKLLEQVWGHLLSNALKFTQASAEPRIEIGAGVTDGIPHYLIRDNGIGFDMKYVHKLFGVFQRLHIEDEYEGTGMGLALAGRIIEQHRGKIWAVGRVNEGATFFFTLDEEAK